MRPRPLTRALTAPFLLAVAALALGGFAAREVARQFSGEAEPRAASWIDLSDTRAVPGDPPIPPAGEDVLRIAVAPVLSPEHSTAIYEQLFACLSRRIGRRAHVVHGRNYGEVNKLVRYRHCELASICVFAFVRGNEEFGMEVLAVPVVRGSLAFHSLIVTRSDSNVRSLLELRGKRFASSDLLSASGWLYPVVQLRNAGEDASTFFARHLITGSHDRTIRSVLKGCADGGAVDSAVYDFLVGQDPRIASELRIVERSPPFGAPPIVVHPSLDPELRARLLAALLSLHEDDEGRAALAAAGIDRFVVAPEDLYGSVRSLVARLDERE